MILLSIKRILNRCYFAAFMAITFMFYSCTKDKTAANLAKKVAGKYVLSAYTDRDVYDGVMFLQGPVATDLLRDYTDFNFTFLILNPAQIDSVHAIQDSVVSFIVASNPNYLQTFRSHIGSGNYDTISTAIINAASDFYYASLTIQGKNDPADDSTIRKNGGDLLATIVKQNKLTPNSTAAQLQAAAKKTQEDNNVWLWVIAVVAAVVAAVFFWLGLVTNPDGPNTYESETYMTAIATDLVGI
ncbi:MAG TPA: hypothetical protein VN721_04160 [Flavipsychrobacter sp.]|nr:hypothetical protein [Flavipsychrobacter sp.]